MSDEGNRRTAKVEVETYTKGPHQIRLTWTQSGGYFMDAERYLRGVKVATTTDPEQVMAWMEQV